MIFQTLRRQRGVIAAVLLAFLAFRALLPVGVMPAQGADGAWTVQLCTGQGLQTVVLDAAGHPGKPAAPAEHDTGYCALAGALVAASSPAAFSFVPVVSVARFLPPPSAVAVPRFALLRVQSARGPPFYS